MTEIEVAGGSCVDCRRPGAAALAARESRASCADLLPRPLALPRRRSLALLLSSLPLFPPSSRLVRPSTPVHAVRLSQLISQPPRGGLRVRPVFVVSPCSHRPASTPRRRAPPLIHRNRCRSVVCIPRRTSRLDAPFPSRGHAQSVRRRAAPVRREIIVFSCTPPVSPAMAR